MTSHWKKGSFIFNMTLFLLGMNLAAGVITEIGLFEVRRYDVSQIICTNLRTDTPSGLGGQWTAQRGGNGFCTLDSMIDNEYNSELEIVVRESVCVDPIPDQPCTAKTYQDEGVPIPKADTVLKTLGDVSAAIEQTAKIFSGAIVSPLGWLTEAWDQCTDDPDNDIFSKCTDEQRDNAASWNQIINYVQIPIYFMYGIFLIQIIMNRSFRGVT